MGRKRKNKSPIHVDSINFQSPVWRLVFAVFWFSTAVFLLLGNFGFGGPLPKALSDIFASVFGNARYFVPLWILLVMFLRLKREDKTTPWLRVVVVLVHIVFLSALLHLFKAPAVDEIIDVKIAGGEVGRFFGDIFGAALSNFVGIILTFIVAFVTFLLSLGVSPKSFFGHVYHQVKKDHADGKGEKLGGLAAIKSKIEQSGFKLNEGVPLVRHDEPSSPRGVTLRNSMEKLTPAENHVALTVASDPNWQFPGLSLLNQKQDKADAGDVAGNARIIQETLANFDIHVEMESANVGPRVTQFTLKPPSGVKLTKLTALESNIALDLAAQSIRMEAPIPGKRAVGIEVPNIKGATVRVSSALNSPEWKNLKNPLGFVIGRDIAGQAVVGALDKMPHLLVAGQTGSGKSVMINTILTSFMYKCSPSDLKLILVDPKQVELTPYNDIPHLLTPVITEPEKCISALKWAVAEMERRLRTMAGVGKRNIQEYNSIEGESSMPYIVIVIDELADLMMMAARDVESLIVRIAQKARAAGIHLILATQRPSVDVITGIIKANIPARISFTVASQIDSRTIIDQAGSEKLLGMGDMLLLTSDMAKPRRVQGAFIDEPEIREVMDFVRAQRPPQYNDEVVSMPVQLNGKGGIVAQMDTNDADDDMWKDAVQVVIEGRKASTSLLQRRLRVGYSRAARLIETMEEQGIVGPADGARPREVLVNSMEDVFGGANSKANGGDGDVYDDMPDM
jgi:DNA segregation ATPase FtsK/SpoIIIE, S-DNA-T family